ncbi:MAG: MFS transporter [Candidatus Micrarchaeota archaeon]|nr:MFS transporter [Candidatus Micrarchaeota archaeon]
MFNLSFKSLSSQFAKLNIMYVFWLAANILGGSLFEVYLFGLGMSITEIISTGLVWFMGSLLLAPLFRKVPAKKFMLIGIALGFLSILVLYAMPTANAGYLFRFLLGLTHFFFWVPFNALFYEFKKENNALMGAMYYSVGSSLNIILPGISGLIAAIMGYGNLFILAMIAYAATFLIATKYIQNDKVFYYNLADCLKSLSGLKTLIFLEGFAPAVIVTILLDLMILKYLDQPAEFGAFISLATIFAIIASLITAKISDLHKRRREFIILSSIAFGLASIFTSFSKEIGTFLLGFAMINFFKTVFFPLPMALVVDNSKNIFHSMLGREWLLNLGRICGIASVFLLTLKYGTSEALLFCGTILAIVYPIIFELKKSKLDKI